MRSLPAPRTFKCSVTEDMRVWANVIFYLGKEWASVFVPFRRQEAEPQMAAYVSNGCIVTAHYEAVH